MRSVTQKKKQKMKSPCKENVLRTFMCKPKHALWCYDVGGQAYTLSWTWFFLVTLSLLVQSQLPHPEHDSKKVIEGLTSCNKNLSLIFFLFLCSMFILLVSFIFYYYHYYLYLYGKLCLKWKDILPFLLHLFYQKWRTYYHVWYFFPRIIPLWNVCRFQLTMETFLIPMTRTSQWLIR